MALKFRGNHVWTASNVSYNDKTFEGRSYGWWTFQRLIGGWLVYNSHHYSNTTAKHQSLVRRQTTRHYDLVVETRISLDEPAWVEDAVRVAKIKIEQLREEIARPRSHHAKNAERRQKIGDLEGLISTLAKGPFRKFSRGDA